MKKSLFNVALRDIFHNFSRYLSIMLIIAIGTAFFIGIKVTNPDMKLTVDEYFDQYNMEDLNIFSTTGFTNPDLNSIKNVSGIETADAGYKADAMLVTQGGSYVVRAYSYSASDTVNIPELTQGRLPVNAGECVIEQNKISGIHIPLNSQITLSDPYHVLKTDTFTVVGIVNSTLYISSDRGISALGNGKVSAFMMINEQDFAMPLYNNVSITVSGAKSLETDSAAYNNKINSVLADLKTMAKANWVVKSRNDNPGYTDYLQSADRMNAISEVFPVIFILVAQLICFTSMTRMVEEQRGLIGTAKALGYRKISILFKYLIYAVTASFFGGLIGIAIGFTLFPAVLFHAFSILYTLPRFIRSFNLPFALVALLVGMAVTAGSAVFVALSELKETAATLMRPKAPKPGKKVFIENIPFIWNKLKFTQKVTARNLLRYRSRFYMTVIGIAGCITLLLIGFGLKDSISTIGHVQFGDIYRYQMTVYVNNTDDSAAAADIDNAPGFEGSLNLYDLAVDVGKGNVTKSVELIVPSDAAQMNNFINLRTRIGKTPLPLTDNGVVLTEKLANMLDVKTGDDLTITTGDYKTVTVKVTGITENYLLHYIYMSDTLYEILYGNTPNYNETVVKLNNLTTAEQNTLSTELLSLRGVLSVQFSSDHLKIFNDMIGSINYIVYVLIVSAALLSFVVLYTLTNINVSERTREIATIKVLGFFDKEVAGYVYRENIILTLIGIAIGLFGGTYLAHYIIVTAEVEMVMFGRQIFVPSYLYSALLTILFSLFVNLVMLRVLRRINMVEALKSIE